jgi:hypothetical protein
MRKAEPPANNHIELTDDQKAMRDPQASLKHHRQLLAVAEEADAAGDERRAQAIRRIIGD